MDSRFAALQKNYKIVFNRLQNKTYWSKEISTKDEDKQIELHYTDHYRNNHLVSKYRRKTILQQAYIRERDYWLKGWP